MATRIQAKPLTDAIMQSVREKAAASRTWFDRLSADEKRELTSVRDEFLAGKYPGTVGVVASAIVAACKARGIRTSGRQGVVAWLKKST